MPESAETAGGGVVFYMDGPGHAPLLAVAVRTLRRSYGGPVAAVLGASTPGADRLAAELEAGGVMPVLEPADCLFQGGGRVRAWLRKSAHHFGLYPFGVNLYFDLDHLFLSFDQSLFDRVAEKGLLACRNPEPHPQSRRRMAQVAALFGPGHPGPYHGMNGGMSGSVRGHPRLPMLRDALDRVAAHATNGSDGVQDEMAWAWLEARGEAGSVGYGFSLPVSGPPTAPLGRPMALHLTRGSYLKCREWLDELAGALADNTLGCADDPRLFDPAGQAAAALSARDAAATFLREG